jgi:hypothetical protein
MGLELARQAIATAVEAAKVGSPTTPLIIEYDNRIIVDTQTQTKPFLCVNMVLMDGRQADLNAKPIHRFDGQIHIAAAVKEGAGSADALKLLDHFYPQLHQRALGILRTHMAKAAPMKPHLGWCYYPMLIPFWFDKTY